MKVFSVEFTIFADISKEKGIYTLDETAQNYTIHYQPRIAVT
ncbi:hypothetical protein BC792_105183 [Sphingobacterium allocomposti]|jgi:hypothetical protein|uniref:Uncharacterized protein n=1 Tax=Sphingobacterium allocomposti TaxID=415956 RepID=A0A5S5DL86_9SPHI|nr:hypothetical protein BC792_105183 [Sphingobacterium composti Yoo et al. 2007 non Ten et al. 2007]